MSKKHKTQGDILQDEIFNRAYPIISKGSFYFRRGSDLIEASDEIPFNQQRQQEGSDQGIVTALVVSTSFDGTEYKVSVSLTVNSNLWPKLSKKREGRKKSPKKDVSLAGS